MERRVLEANELGALSGFKVLLRLANPEDAEFVYNLRIDPAYNSHLSPITGGIAGQVEWIKNYKRREQASSEFYFIIERIDDLKPCGVVRLYDINNDTFTWGSWILNQDKPPKAALDSAMLIYSFGFRKLGLKKAVFEVDKKNTHTINFHERFGAKFVSEDELNRNYELSANEFDMIEMKLSGLFDAK